MEKSPAEWMIESMIFALPLGITISMTDSGDRSVALAIVIGLAASFCILLLVWYCIRGTIGPNRFGSDPLDLDTLVVDA